MKFYSFILPVILLISSISYAAADQTILVQQYDIAELMMNKYKLTVGQDEFTLFYKLSTAGSLSEDTHEDLDAKITSIEVNQERQSLVITLDNIAQTDIMSLRLSKDLISAEGKQLALFINGKETMYEWSATETYNNLIFLVPKQTTEIEVIGTRVIPEFPSGLLILIVSSAVLVLPFVRRFNR